MILVTGGTGFLGAYVIAGLLSAGKKVRATRRTSSDMGEVNSILQHKLPGREELIAGVEWVEADVLDIVALEEAMKGVEYVYHCAALVSFMPRDSKRMLQVNAEGTANVVNAALSAGGAIKKFCYVSSIAALGRSKYADHIAEDSKWEESALNSAYAVSKHRGELEVWRGIEEGLNAVIVNPGVILGFGDWNRGTGKIFRRMYRGNPFYTRGVSGYVDVNDVAAAMIKLTESDVSAERFVLVSENAEWKSLLDMIATGFGKAAPAMRLPRWMVELGWRMLYVFSLMSNEDPLLTRETARSAYNRFYYSSEKIAKMTGFRFMPLEESIKRICNEFLQKRSNSNSSP